MNDSLDVIALGMHSPYGNDVESHLALANGSPPSIEPHVQPAPNGYGGTVRVRPARPVHPRAILKNPKTAKFLAPEMVLLLSAVRSALQEVPAIASDRMAAVVVTAPPLASIADLDRLKATCLINGELQLATLAQDLSLVLPSTWPSRCIKALSACHIAAEMEVLGPNIAIAPVAGSWITSLLVASMLLNQGLADLVLVGAADSRIDPMSISERLARRARSGECVNAMKPFSEGAAVLAAVRPGEHRPSRIARIWKFGKGAAFRAELENSHDAVDGAEHPAAPIRFDGKELPNSAVPFPDRQGDSDLGHCISVSRLIGEMGVAGDFLALAGACLRASRCRPMEPAYCCVTSGGDIDAGFVFLR